MQLPAIARERDLFSILALDEINELSQSLSLDLSLADNVDFLQRVLTLLFELTPEASGLVLDPVYTLPLLPAAKDLNSRAGILLRLAQHQAVAPEQVPALFPNFSLYEVKNNYALAKLTLSYQAHEEQALAKKQLLAEIKDYCQTLGLSFLLKLAIPSDNEELLLSSIQEVRNLADILVLSNIKDPLMAATITSELDVPWLLSADSSSQLDYEQFKEQLRVAMENGARGYYLGNFLWKELANCRSAEQSFVWPEIEKLVRFTLRDHLIELNRIVGEAAL